jgi:RNA polymerase primary sigma factor
MRLKHFQIDNCQLKSIENYFKEIDKFDLLDPEEEIELTSKARKGDLHAFDKLIEANLRFVITVAKQYQKMGLPFEDLICEGNLVSSQLNIIG